MRPEGLSMWGENQYGGDEIEKIIKKIKKYYADFMQYSPWRKDFETPLSEK